MYGLASIAMALNEESWAKYLDDILLPVMASLDDVESKVKQAAIDSLYNITRHC